MAMSPALRNRLIAVAGGGAIAIATVLIPSLEGVDYTPYRDIGGVWTVCYGHAGKDIMLGKTYTEQECRALLNKDLGDTAKQIDPYIKTPISNNTRAALYSFSYNVGVKSFKTSTLLYLLNKGDTSAACDQLRRWIHVKGKKITGLANRREIERELCKWGDT